MYFEPGDHLTLNLKIEIDFHHVANIDDHDVDFLSELVRQYLKKCQLPSDQEK